MRNVVLTVNKKIKLKNQTVDVYEVTKRLKTKQGEIRNEYIIYVA